MKLQFTSYYTELNILIVELIWWFVTIVTGELLSPRSDVKGQEPTLAFIQGVRKWGSEVPGFVFWLHSTTPPYWV